MPRKIPQSKRLKPKKGFDIITVKDRKGNEIRQRFVKRGSPLTDKPSESATGTGGRTRQRKIDEVIDDAMDDAN